MGSRQNSYWISLSVMLTNVQTHTYRHTHTDTQTRTYRRTGIQTVSSWIFTSCEPHTVISRRIPKYKLFYASSNQKSLNYKSKAGL